MATTGIEQKLNELMKEYYVTFGELATRLGVSKQTLTRKMKGATDWTYPEMMLLAQIFNIQDIPEFFFS
nr:helix-turn-helix transcriptional regulator [uncultured Cellulosilyticum sp.]